MLEPEKSITWSNHTSSSNASNAAVVPQNSSARPACSLTPTLAAHFNENLIKHVQGWPADHAEQQASRLREEAHNMGSVFTCQKFVLN